MMRVGIRGGLVGSGRRGEYGVASITAMAAAITLTAGLIIGLVIESGPPAPAAPAPVRPLPTLTPTTPTTGPATSSASPSAHTTTTSVAPTERSTPATTEPPPVSVGDRATISIPAIGLQRRTTVFYRGSPDDRPGTKIQNTGRLAAPIGPRGGVGPGHIGNLIVAGHRTSAGGPLRDLPDLRRGDRVLVTYQEMIYGYEITGSLWVTFHDPGSYAKQVAPVPGHPGRTPTTPVITLTTCATPEDRAAGDFELDELGNPPHRIDKIGVLVDVRPRA
jgi:sortase A